MGAAQLVGKAASVSVLGEIMMGSALGVVGASVWKARISFKLLVLTLHRRNVMFEMY